MMLCLGAIAAALPSVTLDRFEAQHLHQAPFPLSSLSLVHFLFAVAELQLYSGEVVPTQVVVNYLEFVVELQPQHCLAAVAGSACSGNQDACIAVAKASLLVYHLLWLLHQLLLLLTWIEYLLLIKCDTLLSLCCQWLASCSCPCC